MVNYVSVHEKDHLVELRKDLGGGLVNCGDYGTASLGEFIEEADQVEGCGGVETGGGLVEEDD